MTMDTSIPPVPAAQRFRCFTGQTFAVHGLVATDGTMDPECRALCETLARMPGVEVLGACSGHGFEPLRVWYTAFLVPAVLWAALTWACDLFGWQVGSEFLCPCCPPLLSLTSHQIGLVAYAEAAWIAEQVAMRLQEEGYDSL